MFNLFFSLQRRRRWRGS